jgi:hypothetical protein
LLFRNYEFKIYKIIATHFHYSGFQETLDK